MTSVKVVHCLTSQLWEVYARFPAQTYPQILNAVNQCAQHNVSPNNTHATAVKRIFRYLQGTKAKGLLFLRGNGSLTLKVFCDADFGGEPEGNDQPMRSTSGLLVYLYGVGPLYWKLPLLTSNHYSYINQRIRVQQC